MTPEQQLSIISKAWGRQRGYCFFPWIDGDAKNREERIRSYHEGPAFLWPRDKDKILKHVAAHTSDDLYWCPSLFEKSQRKMELAMDEHCLWADLDEVDPRGIEDYPPTIAWESSPGRYQALWLIQGGLMGASWRGKENHRLTYYIDADPSGWDTTQLLRIPGWDNHKFEYWQNGTKAVEGKLLWQNGRRYMPDDFEDLPEVQSAGAVTEILEGEIDHVDRHEVWGRVRLKVTKHVRDLVGAREASGDRSNVLWQIERELADAGCTVTEIVAVVRATVWNKYSGRQDELRRLTIEASKAIESRADTSEKSSLEPDEDEDKPTPQSLFSIIRNVRQPEWLVNDIVAVGSCGFIAGQPKSFKSWIALDLMFSVATGIPFLDKFSVRRPGPVLYIQEEDSAPMVKSRVSKVWPGKQADKVKLDETGQLVWLPSTEHEEPPINAVITAGVVISDPGWQSWLDDMIAQGYKHPDIEVPEPYVMVMIDPLMMVAGDVDENRSQEMTNKIFKPLKVLAHKHDVAVQVVHHMKKTDPSKPGRGGQMMLGSVANHAWSEDSLYLRHGPKGNIIVERESKHTTSGQFTVTGLRNKKWTPQVIDDRLDIEDDPIEMAREGQGSRAQSTRSSGPGRQSKALLALKERGGAGTTKQIAEVLGISPSGAYRQLARLMESGKLTQTGQVWKVAK